jgi:hypothetical protein
MKLSNVTKGMVIAVIILFTLSTTMMAKDPRTEKAFKDKVVKNLLYSMNSDLNSIVESSLFVVLQVKENYPNEDYGKLLIKLNQLTNSGPTISIRYKAQLTSLFINYPDFFKDIKNIKLSSDNDNPDTYFKMIANKVEASSLVAN